MKQKLRQFSHNYKLYKKFVFLSISLVVLTMGLINFTGFWNNISNYATIYKANLILASTEHEPITIDGNEALDNFCADNGTDGITLETAHVIKNYEIINDGTCMVIRNTDRYLIIRNCSFYITSDFLSAVIFQNIKNIVFENCTIFAVGDSAGLDYIECVNVKTISCNFYQTNRGVYYFQSSNIVDKNNTYQENYFGMAMSQSNKTIIENDTFILNDRAISLMESNTTKIINNRIEHQMNIGILLADKNYDNIIENNNITYNEGYGIYQDTCTDTQNNTVRNNNISHNTMAGIFWGTLVSTNTKYSNIYGNKVFNNSLEGIVLNIPVYIYGNEIYNNTLSGITGATSNSQIIGNNITNNGYDGINFSAGMTNRVWLNYITDNNFSQANDNGHALWDNGTLGNYWGDHESRYPGRTTSDGIVWDPAYKYQINETIYYDNYPLVNYISIPEIERPADIKYNTGETGYYLRWNITDYGYYNATYRIYANDTLVEEGSWMNGSTIEYNVDGLSEGTYKIFRIELWDGTVWGYNSDEVRVDVKYAPSAYDLVLTPEDPYTNQTLHASYQYSDADEDLEGTSEIRWYKDDELQPYLNDSLSVDPIWTNKSQHWKFSVRPHDGYVFGQIQWSNTIIIKNFKPVVENVTITPDPAYTKDNLKLEYDVLDIDEETLTITIRWYNDSTHLAEFDDLDTLPNIWTNKSDNWYATIEAVDSEESSGEIESNIVEIMNSVPKISNVRISPNNARTADNLQVEYDWIDDDGDLDCSTIVWYNNSVHLTQFDNLDTIDNWWTNKSQVWRVEVTPSDGYTEGTMDFAEITILNTAPSVIITSFTPTLPKTGENLVIDYTFTDIDGDLDNSIIHWYKNGIYQSQLDGLKEINSALTAYGDKWNFTIIPYDGVDQGIMAESIIRTIVNTPPSASNIQITSEVYLIDNIDLTYLFFDIDGHTESGTIIRWTCNSNPVASLNDLKRVPSSMLNVGDVWQVSVQVSDGIGLGDIIFSDEVEVLANNPIQLIIAPEDKEFNFRDSGKLLTWQCNDPNVRNPRYSILRNGIYVVQNQPWTPGSPITFDLSNQPSGIYEFEIIITDGLGSEIIDTVNITIVPDPINDIIIFILMGFTVALGGVVFIKNMYRGKNSRQLEADLLGRSLNPKPIQEVKAETPKVQKKKKVEKKKVERDFNAPDLLKTLKKEPKKEKSNSDSALNDKTLEELRKF